MLSGVRYLPVYVAPVQPQGFGKVEIQVSRREQKLQSAPARVSQSSQQEAAGKLTSSIPVPGWAAIPPSEAALQVRKDGRQIDFIPLTKAMTVFGRYY